MSRREGRHSGSTLDRERVVEWEWMVKCRTGAESGCEVWVRGVSRAPNSLCESTVPLLGPGGKSGRLGFRNKKVEVLRLGCLSTHRSLHQPDYTNRTLMGCAGKRISSRLYILRPPYHDRAPTNYDSNPKQPIPRERIWWSRRRCELPRFEPSETPRFRPPDISPLLRVFSSSTTTLGECLGTFHKYVEPN